MTSADAVTPPVRHLRHIALLCLILLAATALRAYHIGFLSVWTDEIASYELSSGRPLDWIDCQTDRIIRPGPDLTSLKQAAPVTSIFTAMQEDTHPPLYVLILRCWRTMFGESDAAARWLSAICSLIAIVLFYDSVHLMEGPMPALWAAAIMALATPQIQFSQEIRSYAMIAMWALVAVNAVIRIELAGVSPRRLVVLALALFAGMASHYYGASATAAIALYALLRFRGTKRNLTLGAVIVAGAVFAITCLPLLWTQRANFLTNTTWSESPEGLIARTIWRISVLSLLCFFTPMVRSMSFAPISAAFLLLPPLMFRRRPKLLIWWLLAICAIALPAATDLVHSSMTLEQVRYSLPGAAGVYALAALFACKDARGWVRHAVPAVVVGGCLMGLPDAYVQPLKVNRRDFAREFDSLAGPNDVIAVYYTNPGDWYERILYAGLTHYLPQSTRPLLIVTEPVSQTLQQELRAAPNVWLLAQSDAPVERFFPGAIAGQSVTRPFIGQAVSVRWPDAAPSSAAQPKSPPSP